MSPPVSSLQRLSRALLARSATRIGGTDWWAVLVELMVVVLGILIAFQLDAWGKRWQAEQDEKLLLRRIEVEAKSDLASLQEMRDLHVESASNYRKLASAVGNPDANAAIKDGDKSCNLLRLPAVRRHAAGVIGLAAGERGDLVSDPILRDALRRAQAERAFNDSQLNFFRDNFLRYGERIEPHMVWRFGGPEDGASCSVDIDSLRADRPAVAMLPKLYRDQRRFAGYRQREVVATQAILTRLACLHGGPCAVRP